MKKKFGHHIVSVQKLTLFLAALGQIESADQPSIVLMQRHLVLKEAQLRLLIAQNTLQKDQSVAFSKH
ncbi:hypothetical protein [Acinetobacter lwoffii]|uniref:hypothetical protein n=1 Tax=Acinetobacter lwoffii TaxID=28090 RepID=UPI001E29125A|nr:hypothetical protein [Acinetobacter lwoffii]